jgi:multidrug efflux pump subunit AcrA (membrane-fusion protein)
MKSVILILGFTVGFSTLGCGNSSSSAAPQTPSNAADNPITEYVAPDAKGVQTMTVKTTAVPEDLELAAHIETDPTRVVHVFAPAGGRITEMKVRPWDHVEQGQTIAILESSDLARAVADYHKGQADNQVKQKELARSQDLFEHHAVSEKDYQQAQGDAQMAQAEVEAAREQVFSGALGGRTDVHDRGYHDGLGRRGHLRERPRRHQVGTRSTGDAECLSRSAPVGTGRRGFGSRRSRDADLARPRSATQSRLADQAGNVRIDPATEVIGAGDSGADDRCCAGRQ